MDGGVWWAAVHGVARSRTRLSDFTLTFHFHALEQEMATHSSVLAWRIPGTEEPGGLPSMGLQRVGHDWSDLAAAAAMTSVKSFNRVQLFATPWTVAYQAPLSMGFSRQEHWSVLPCPSPVYTLMLRLMLMLSRFSRVRLFATPKTVAHQAPPSMGFSRQEHWSGLPFPSPSLL